MRISIFAWLLAGVVTFLGGIQSCFALDVFDFDSEQQRERYQQLVFELRCPLCQNQNLEDSHSQISQDLRKEIVRQIKSGKSDSEIKTYMVERYGDFILYDPPVKSSTMVLWAGPVAVFLLVLVVFFIILFRRSRLVGEDDSDGDEVEALNQALEGDTPESKHSPESKQK